MTPVNKTKKTADAAKVVEEAVIAEAAKVSESTVYRWLAKPERINIGTVDLIKDLAKLDRDEFTRIFYPETVA